MIRSSPVSEDTKNTGLHAHTAAFPYLVILQYDIYSAIQFNTSYLDISIYCVGQYIAVYALLMQYTQ